MDVPHERVITHLVEIEEVAEDILSDRQQLIDLDRRRQQTREAQRALHKNKKDEKQWVCFGNQFIKIPKPATKKLLEKDFNQLESEINRVRQGLRPKVNKLRNLENKEDAKGFDLNPLTREELQSINDML